MQTGQRRLVVSVLDFEEAATDIESPENVFLPEGATIAQRVESAFIKYLALFKVTDRHGDMIDHAVHPIVQASHDSRIRGGKHTKPTRYPAMPAASVSSDRALDIGNDIGLKSRRDGLDNARKCLTGSASNV